MQADLDSFAQIRYARWPSRSRPAWAGSSLGAPARALAAISSRSSAKVWIAAASGGGVAGPKPVQQLLCAGDLRQAGVDRYRRGGDGVSGPGGVGLQRHPGAHRGVGGAGPRLGVGDLLVGERRPGPPTRCEPTNRPAPQRITSSPSTSPMPTPRPSPRRPRPATPPRRAANRAEQVGRQNRPLGGPVLRSDQLGLRSALALLTRIHKTAVAVCISAHHV